MMNETKGTVKISLVLTPAQAEAFRALAAKHGFITTSGPRAGQGAQNALAAAIATGEMIVYRNPDWSNGTPT